jgi:hypothetical protein
MAKLVVYSRELEWGGSSEMAGAKFGAFRAAQALFVNSPYRLSAHLATTK